MAWSTPPKAVPESLLTADFLNTYLRDNMLETMAAKADNEGNYFGSNGVNDIQIAGYVTATATATVTTTSTSYVALTGGPSVTMTSNHHSFVVLTAEISHSSGTGQSFFSYEINGATFNPAHDQNSLISDGPALQQYSIIIPHTTLVLPGTNTFTARYRGSTPGVSSFGNRSITVFTI